MTYPITPNPAIHHLPSAARAQQNALTAQQLQAMGDQMIQGITNAVLYFMTGGIVGAQAGSNSATATANLEAWFAQMWGQLQSNLTNFSALVTSVGGTTFNDLTQWLQNLNTQATAAYNQIINFLETGNWSDLSNAWNDLLQGLFGSSTTPGILSSIPSTAVTNIVQSLQPVWDFPNSASISAGGDWSWDASEDHTGTSGSGSAKCVANGTLNILNGTPAYVQPGQVVTAQAYVMWSGLTRSGSNPIALNLVLSNGSTFLIGEIASPGSSSAWTEITNTYTVPAGVTTVAMQLEVTAAATGGTVWFDDCKSTVTGGFLADLQGDIQDIIGSFAPGGTAGQFVTGVQNLLALFGLSSSSVVSSTNLNAIWTAVINDIINPLNALEVQAANIIGAIEISAINGLATALSALLGTTIFQSLLDSLANALGHSGTGHTIANIETYLGIIPPTNVTNVLGGANLGADVSSVHATVGTNTTNISTNTTSIASQQAWWNSLATDLWIYADLFHAYYPVGTPSDTATTTSGGRRTWYSAIADMKVLFAAIGSSPPVIAATDIGGAVNTAQSTATSASTAASTAQSTATTANTAAGTAQTTANTANTMFGLGQQAGTNLVLAPGFENAAAWTSASSGTQSAVQAHSGINSWLLQGTGSGNTTTLRLINNSAGPTTLKSRVGEVFQLQGFIFPKAGNAGGGTVKLQIVCTDSTGVNSATTLVAATETVPATGSWSSVSGTAVVPAGYDTVDPQLILLSVPTTDFVYVDDVLVREATLVTTAQSTATAAQSAADVATSLATRVPQNNIVVSTGSGVSSVTVDAAGTGGSATGGVGSVLGSLGATGTHTVGGSASVVVAAVTYSLVGSGGVTGIPFANINGQPMQSLGAVQIGTSTQYLGLLLLWQPTAGASLPVSVSVDARGGGVASVSFETTSYIGAYTASTLSQASGSGTSLSQTVAAATGNMVVQAFSAADVALKNNTALSAYNKTQRGNVTVQVNSTQYGYQSLILGDAVGAASVGFTATGADSSAQWVGASVVLSPQMIPGSTFRQHVASTTTALILSGNSQAGIFSAGVVDYCSSDLTFNNTGPVLTVSLAGSYVVTVSILEAAVTTVHYTRATVYQNGNVAQQGQTVNVTATASGTWMIQATFILECAAGDTIQPGFWSSASVSNCHTGESTGSCTYWEVALANRSLL